MHESYKKVLKEHYEIEKKGEQINSLLNPTPAGLRDLFVYRMEQSNNVADVNVFEQFLGFSYEKNAVNKIKAEIDKFRPLVNFLKDKSDLTEIKRLNALAILLDYPNRPFNKFSNIQKNTTEIIEEKKEEIIEKPNDISKEEVIVKQKEITVVEDLTPKENTQEVIVVPDEEPIKNQRKFPFKEIGIIGIVVIIGISLFINIKNFTTKDCMVWKGEKYEAVDCSETINSFAETTLPKDDKLIKDFRKIKVDNKTSFFDKKGNPKVWYIKNPNGTLEFFNQPGLQPETEKTLKPISKYIIQEYVLK